MKKKLLLLCNIALISCIISCSNSGTNKTEETGNQKKDSTTSVKPADECDDVNIFMVEDTLAYKMIKHFTTTYRDKLPCVGNPKMLSRAIWIDAIVIKTFADYLKHSESPGQKKLDGVRFINGTLSAADSTTLYMVLTSARGEVGSPSYAHTKHTNEWSIKISLPSGTSSQYKNFGIPFKDIKNAENNFQNLYRFEKGSSGEIVAEIDSLSKRVWTSKCVFYYLKKLIISLESNADEFKRIDGIRIYLGAYNEMDTTAYFTQQYPNQSTIIAVPTHKNRNDARKHDDDFGIINKAFNKVLNHGQLCPNQCD